MTTLEQAFDEGYQMGARHAADLLESRLYYVPESWKEDESRVLYNLMQHALNDIMKLYGGRCDGKKD